MAEKMSKNNKNLMAAAGFTLVEIMIAIVIASITAAAIYSTFFTQQKNYVMHDQIIEIQQNVRTGMEMIIRDLRMAGLDPSRNCPPVGFTNATANSVTITYVADDDGLNNDAVGVADDLCEIATITYSLADAYGDGDMDLMRNDGGGNQPVSENIDQLEFFYTLDNGTQTTAPPNLGQIRSVQVSMLARANTIDTNYSNTLPYLTPSGADWSIAPPDNFRRRFLSSRANCRNMGL